MSFADERRHLLNVIESTQAKFRRWVDANQSSIHREDELYTGWKELSEVATEYRKIEGEIFGEAYRFACLYGAFAREVTVSHEDGAAPSDELFAQWDRLEDSLTNSKRKFAPPLESIDELKRLNNMSDRQIAEIYGWMNDNGQADAARVRHELLKPESERKTPKNPNQAVFDHEFSTLTAKVQEYRSRRNKRIAFDRREAPESWESLLLTPGITLEQIAEMKACSIEAVEAEADAKGIPRPPRKKTIRTRFENDHDETPSASARRPPGRPKKAKEPATKELPQADQGGEAADAEQFESVKLEIKGYLDAKYTPAEAAEMANGHPAALIRRAIDELTGQPA